MLHGQPRLSGECQSLPSSPKGRSWRSRHCLECCCSPPQGEGSSQRRPFCSHCTGQVQSCHFSLTLLTQWQSRPWGLVQGECWACVNEHKHLNAEFVPPVFVEPPAGQAFFEVLSSEPNPLELTVWLNK